MFIVLLFAGHETTTNLISIGLKDLLQQRDQWDALCADPGWQVRGGRGGTAAVLEPGPDHQPRRRRRPRDRRRADQGRASGHRAAGRSQPRSEHLRPRRPARHRPSLEPPPGLRLRPALLPRLRARPPRNPGRPDNTRHPAPDDATRRRANRAEVGRQRDAQEARHPAHRARSRLGLAAVQTSARRTRSSFSSAPRNAPRITAQRASGLRRAPPPQKRRAAAR